MRTLRLCWPTRRLHYKCSTFLPFDVSRPGHIFSAQGCTATEANADVDDLKSERRQFKRQPLSQTNTHAHTYTETHTHTRPWSRFERNSNLTAAAAATTAEAATQVLRPYPKLVATRTLQPNQPWLWAWACPWGLESCEIGKLSSDQNPSSDTAAIYFCG